MRQSIPELVGAYLAYMMFLPFTGIACLLSESDSGWCTDAHKGLVGWIFLLVPVILIGVAIWAAVQRAAVASLLLGLRLGHRFLRSVVRVPRCPTGRASRGSSAVVLGSIVSGVCRFCMGQRGQIMSYPVGTAWTGCGHGGRLKPNVLDRQSGNLMSEGAERRTPPFQSAAASSVTVMNRACVFSAEPLACSGRLTPHTEAAQRWPSGKRSLV
jgi:hypothetical protein